MTRDQKIAFVDRMERVGMLAVTTPRPPATTPEQQEALIDACADVLSLVSEANATLLVAALIHVGTYYARGHGRLTGRSFAAEQMVLELREM
jgi:hypothetical protein